MHLKLPDQILTTFDWQSFLAALQTKNPDASQTVLLDAFWRANPKISPDQSFRPALMKQADHMNEALEKVTVSFAQQPDTEFLVELITWFRVNIKAYLVLDVQTDPLLIGGMVLRSNEHLYDWSLRHKLTDTKPKLTELLHAS